MVDAFPLKIRFLGGEAKKHRLEFYDGADALFGFAKSIRLASHYLFTGKVAFQAPSAKGVQLYMVPPKAGSYEQPIHVEFVNDELIVNGKRVPVSSEVFQDFITQALNNAVGNQIDPETDEVNEIITAKPGDIDVLSEALDGPLKGSHRFIGKARSHKSTKLITDVSGGDEEIVKFDGDTLDYLNTRIYADNLEDVIGTVAAYNRNSVTGRFYVPDLQRTVPFKPEKGVAIKDRTPLIWSMDRQEHGLDGLITIRVRRVSTKRGVTKGFLLHDCDQI